MRVALGFGAAALVVGVLAVRRRYDEHISAAQAAVQTLQSQPIPQTSEEDGNQVSDVIALQFQSLIQWQESGVVNQVMTAPPKIRLDDSLEERSTDDSEEESKK